jgi:hypothetical protein
MSKCALHPFSEATHYCSGCERPLCEECGTRLSYCGACGQPVLRYGEERGDHWVDQFFDKAMEHYGEGDPVAAITLHGIIPAAVIGMVYSLLFYLLLIRSLFFGNTGSLQWIGFLFIMATVLTARYGRTRNDSMTQAAYTIVMLAATGMALMTRSESTAAAISSMVLLALVWLYATGVTYALSLEGKGEKSTHGAVAPVVGLGVFAIIGFAIGEPFMLNAPPEVAIQAILAIIMYLLSTGLVLAAASTTSQARRAFRAGGTVALRVMPLRIGVAAIIALALMAVSLSIPGVHYSGTGRLGLAPDELLQQRRFALGSDPTAGMLGNEVIDGLPWGWLSGFESMTTRSGQARAAMAVVKLLQYTGAALLLLALLAVIAFAVQQRADVLGKLGPTIGRYLDWLRRKFASKVPDWARRDRGGRRRIIDPFADLDGLRARPAREAVVEAYLRSTVLLEGLGHPRPPAATPYDLLGSLPERLSHLSEPLDEITELYVRAEYSNQEIVDADRDGAVATLLSMRDRLTTAEAT